MKVKKLRKTIPDKEEKPIDVPVVPQEASLKIEETKPEASAAPLDQRNQSLYVIGSAVSLLVVILSLVFFIFYIKNPPSQKKVIVPTNVINVTPIAKPKLDKSLFSFEVLNGSGVNGMAASAADKISALGFTIIKIGNASSVKETELYLQDGLSSESVSLLLEALKDGFNISTVSGVLKDTTASARLIIGSK